MSKNFSILIIEPSQTEQFLYSEIFLNSGFDIIYCCSVHEALDWLKKNNSIEILITDLYLPDFAGISVVKEIRKRYSLPIIVVSSIPYQNRELKKIPNTEAFYKPYNMTSLMHSVLRFSKV